MSGQTVNKPPNNWHRIILHIFWVIFGIDLLTRTSIFFVMRDMYPDEFEAGRFLYHYMVLPVTLLLFVLGAIEAAYRRRFKYAEWLLVLGANVVAFSIAGFVSAELLVGPFIFAFPLLVSMILLQRKYLFFSTFIALLYMAWFIQGFPRIDGESITSFTIMGVFFVGACMTGIGVISRGRELQADLESKSKSEQELMIRNIVMDRLSKIDALTELYNHKTFHEYFEKLVEHQHVGEFPMQLAVIDIDNFKKVNDTYGHWVGDIVLKAVAVRIREQLGADDFAARYGGEEFVVILTGKAPAAALCILESIRAAIEGTNIDEMEGRSVTVSIGAHTYGKGNDKPYVFQQADAALYEAKRTGKNKVVTSDRWPDGS